jgi:alpha-glucosidase
MRKSDRPVFRPANKFTISELGSQRVLLRSANVTAELSVLAKDLFRLRIARGKRFSSRPSWAVVKANWPEIPVRVRQLKRQAAVSTAQANLSFRLSDGRWDFTDANGRPLFSAAADTMGFAGEEARFTLTLADDESIFGLGETTGTYNKRGLIRQFWNTDVLGHQDAIYPSFRSLYVSIPFGISLRGDCAAGLFWDNPARQTWDVGQTRLDQWQMKAASGEIDLYLFAGSTSSRVTRS